MDINKDTFIITFSGDVDRKDDYEWWDATIGGHSIDAYIDYDDVYAVLTLVKKKKCTTCKLFPECQERHNRMTFCEKWEVLDT